MKGFFLAASVAGLSLGGILLTGCKPSTPAPVAEQKAEQKTTAKSVIEGVTGKAAVDQGISARDKLHAIDKQRRKDMEALDQ